jgi:hypothetical protein
MTEVFVGAGLLLGALLLTGLRARRPAALRQGWRRRGTRPMRLMTAAGHAAAVGARPPPAR